MSLGQGMTQPYSSTFLKDMSRRGRGAHAAIHALARMKKPTCRLAPSTGRQHKEAWVSCAHDLRNPALREDTNQLISELSARRLSPDLTPHSHLSLILHDLRYLSGYCRYSACRTLVRRIHHRNNTPNFGRNNSCGLKPIFPHLRPYRVNWQYSV